MPEGLHADLARAADRAGMSLNAYITETLAQTVGRPREQAASAKPRRGSRKLVERLLVVNVLVLAAVGGLAIALLVQALR
jgi:hypothetical protein